MGGLRTNVLCKGLRNHNRYEYLIVGQFPNSPLHLKYVLKFINCIAEQGYKPTAGRILELLKLWGVNSLTTSQVASHLQVRIVFHSLNVLEISHTTKERQQSQIVTPSRIVMVIVYITYWIKGPDSTRSVRNLRFQFNLYILLFYQQ